MAEMSDEASQLMRHLLNLHYEDGGVSLEMVDFLNAFLFPKYSERPIGEMKKEVTQPSEDAIELLKELLALHYIEGGVPASIVALVETELRAVKAWFHDPQYPYLEGEGYV
jgi:hypothetical protein